MGVPQRHDAADARIEALGDALDDAALAGRVAPLEDHHHLQAFEPHPFLQLDEFELQAGEFVDVGVVLARRLGRPRVAQDVPAPLDARLLLGVAAHLVANFQELRLLVLAHGLPRRLPPPWPHAAANLPR